MAVFRVERTDNYTVMSNHHLRDKALSLKAKGLLSLMLSLPEDWDYTLAGLARISLEGKDAIRAAVAELEAAGYVQRRQTTDRAGKFGVNEYIIRERPAEGPSSAPPLSGNPTTEEPSTDSTLTEKPTQIKKDSTSKEKIKTDLVSKDSFPFPSTPPAPVRPQPPEAKGRKRSKELRQADLRFYRELIRENIGYDQLAREQPHNAGRLDEMVELMAEAVCSQKKHLRVAGDDFPQAAVKSRLLKLDGEHIRFVFDCLRENTTQVRNMKQYLLTVLYNAPVTMESYYAARVNHDLFRAPMDS